jgi:hypothetical protein
MLGLHQQFRAGSGHDRSLLDQSGRLTLCWLFRGVGFQALQQERGAFTRYHLRRIGPVRAFELLELLGPPLFRGIAILRGHLCGINQLLGESGNREKQRDERNLDKSIQNRLL